MLGVPMAASESCVVGVVRAPGRGFDTLGRGLELGERAQGRNPKVQRQTLNTLRAWPEASWGPARDGGSAGGLSTVTHTWSWEENYFESGIPVRPVLASCTLCIPFAPSVIPEPSHQPSPQFPG